MRKVLICLIGAIILCNCEISPKKAHAQTKVADGLLYTEEYNIDGMKYIAFIYSNRNDNHGGISVVNVTRDKLQTEIITENLKRLKNGKSSNSTGD